MAGQARRGSRDRGHSSHHGSPLALAAAGSAAERGTEPTAPTTDPGQAQTQAQGRATAQPQAPATVATPRSVSRLLQMKGMTPDEAANLTAFLYGLPTADLRWTLPQLNQLLFLRGMQHAGRFGADDGDLPDPTDQPVSPA